jgi:hypothetical protein
MSRIYQRRRRHHGAKRHNAASEAIKKTGNWQKVFRERIEGLSWGAMADTSPRGLRPQLALPTGRWGASAGLT